MGKPIESWIIELFVAFAEKLFNGFIETFNNSLTVISVEVGKTPMDFSPAVVNTLRGISSNVITPIAGILLTYVFVSDLINLLLEKNNMAEFDTFNLFKSIFKTFLAILLVTNAFNISMAFFDLGKDIVNSVTVGNVALSPLDLGGILETASESAGSAMMVTVFALIAWVGAWIGTAMIYLIVWSRIVTVLVYVSVAPIPFATFMNRDWIGHIGQNYLKNLMAYALQGFLMMVVLVVYGALITNVLASITNADLFLGIVMLLVCMFVCVKTLMSTLNLSKSIFGAN